MIIPKWAIYSSKERDACPSYCDGATAGWEPECLSTLVGNKRHLYVILSSFFLIFVKRRANMWFLGATIRSFLGRTLNE